ncbi:DUF349 domain-containing protein [Faecalibacter macacae]|uniref:DUF349 domain-containing protein n=1 Tax=Faecalibacter macacae TaxID=1859289 RepID=A0A3L9MJ85_9FLAO|nr:DUF349 domain-containing protein [Faecalibacter macacae]RLZ10719.1 DUF349 domain-containing protein [Faecalibacter macacae]
MSIEMDNLHSADGQNLANNTSNDLNNESYKLSENNDTKQEAVIERKDYNSFGFDVLIDEAKNLLNKYPVNQVRNHIEQIKEVFRQKIENDENQKKEAFLADGGDVLDFRYENSYRSKFSLVYNDYKNQLSIYHKENEKQEKENLVERLSIVDELKALYTEQNESNTQMFKSFRDLKTRWHNAGRIPASNAENVFKNYFFHLDNFYKYLDMNKELQALDYQHNLEVRYSIIKRAEELVEEENVQKALNELQYLHRLWKEEAVPVIEEKREETWQQFKAITNKIHDRKSVLNERLKKEQIVNYEKKIEIINRIKEISEATAKKSHSEWQKAIKDINDLRDAFLTIGRVPKDKNNKTWDAFKEATREFNHIKNDFYKTLKNDQQDNLKKKLALLEIAKEHKDSRDWNNSVKVIKKIQNDWKNIGHVPRKNSDKIWKEFKDTCNQFFDRYKNRQNEYNEEFEQNLVEKTELLKEFKEILIPENKEEALSLLTNFNAKWNKIGKLPNNKAEINQEYSKLYNEKLKSLQLSQNQIQDYKLQAFVDQIVANRDNRLLDDEIRKTKKVIEDLEKEINQLDNNVSFFANANANSPLLKDVYKQIDEKRTKLTNAEVKLRTLYSVEF